MPELGPLMRALELQRVIEDKVTEWRERSARVAGATVADSYQQPLNFKRRTHRRKNSAEINRIIAKYSRPNKRADESHHTTTRNTLEAPPVRPPRVKKLSNFKLFSKSEDNLANMGDIDARPNPAEDKPRFNVSKYNTKSCEDITVFVDVHHTMKSKHFEQTSILNAKAVAPNRRPKLHSISEDLTNSSILRDSGLDLRPKSEFITSTPLSKRKTCPSESSVSVFEKCSNFSNSACDLRKGSSEPDIISVSTIKSLDSAKTIDYKKKWKLLKPPFKKGAFDCLLLWRKKPRQMDTDATTR